MKHLDDAAALALAEVSADVGLPDLAAPEGGTLAGVAPDHVSTCARCRKLIDEYRLLLEAVRSCEQPPESLMRWARAYTGAASRPRPSWRTLPLVARGGALVAAVRGAEVVGQALLYGDERHQLDMRFEQASGHKASLHGQLVPLQDVSVEGWVITVIRANGRTETTRTDSGGEFWIGELRWGERLSLVAEGEDERIVIARVAAGEISDEDA